MAPQKKTNSGKEKRVTRYTYEKVMEPRTPETGHTALLPADELVVTVAMDNGWTKALKVGELSEGDKRPVVADMDPAVDPILFWSGKRNRRQVAVLPLQRNEIVSDSRIAQIIERARKAAAEKAPQLTLTSMFADLEKSFRESDKSKRIEFYTHDEGWKNKLICGDSLSVMESLMHYERLRGQIQTIYIDPPYGIKYDSNFQQRIDSTENDEKDQADDVIAIKAFQDTWTLGIHSYLSYLHERLYLCRELLSETGSVFVQIGDKNQHLLRALLDEVFGAENFVVQIFLKKTPHHEGALVEAINDHIIWYAKNKSSVKYRPLYKPWSYWDADLDKFSNIEMPDGSIRKLTREEKDKPNLIPPGGRLFRADVTMTQDGETS